MIWNKNVEPFIPSLILNDDWSDYSIEELVDLSIGRNMLQIVLHDNSMYERFFKNDVITIKILGNDFPQEEDALILLPDNSLIFRHYEIQDDKIILSPLYDEFCEKESYPINAIKIIGVAVTVMR